MTKPFDRHKLEEEVFSNAVVIQELWRFYLMDSGMTDGLSMSQLTTMSILKAHQPMASRRVGETLHITPGAVTQIVDVLVKEGLAERQPNAIDRRIIDLSLTTKGEEMLDEIMQKRRDVFVKIYEVISDEHLIDMKISQQKVLEQLQKLSASVRKEIRTD